MNYNFNEDSQDDYGLKYINEYGYGLICKDYKIEFPPQHQDKHAYEIFDKKEDNCIKVILKP